MTRKHHVQKTYHRIVGRRPQRLTQHNPADTRDPVGEHSQGDAAQTRDAIAAAPAWGLSTPLQRFDSSTLPAPRSFRAAPNCADKVLRPVQMTLFCFTEVPFKRGLDIVLDTEAMKVVPSDRNLRMRQPLSCCSQLVLVC